jgi:hypothetical protein
MALANEPGLTTVAREPGSRGDKVRVIRTTVVAGAIVLALACAAPASAESPYDFAAGGGETAAGDQFAFTAHDGPTGPSGYVTYSTATFDVSGAVTCINAGGGRLATIGIVVENSSDPALVGQGFLLYVEDRDAVDSAAPDRISYAFFVDPRPATRQCAVRRPIETVVLGNIVVEDSPDVDPPEEPVEPAT